MENIFRDFIYMDKERLKSIVAQLNKGLIEGTSKTVTNADEGKIKTGVDILKLFQLGNETSFLWQNQATESHTLHDYLYNLAESLLKEKNLLMNIPGEIKAEDIANPTVHKTS